MIKKIGIVDFIKIVQNLIEKNTLLRAYDYVPVDEKPPFAYVELYDKRAENTKSMWGEVFNILVHIVAEKSNSKVEMYKLITEIEEAFTEELRFEDNNISVIRQDEIGLQSLEQEETGSWHAILEFEIKLCYGFKVKI